MKTNPALVANIKDKLKAGDISAADVEEILRSRGISEEEAAATMAEARRLAEQGDSAAVSEPAAARPINEPRPAGTKSGKKWLFALILLLIVLGGGGALYLYFF